MRCTVGIVLAATVALGLAGCTRPPRERNDSPTKAAGEASDTRFQPLTPEEDQAITARPRGGLRLVIRSEKTEYAMDQPIVVDLRLENVTSPGEGDKARDIPVYFEPFAETPKGGRAEWLFKFFLQREEDDKLVYRSPEFELPRGKRDDYYHFVTLPPQAFVGRRFFFPPARFRKWLEPGRYSLLASYAVGEPFSYILINRHLSGKHAELLGKKLAYKRVWTGRLYSNRVRFRIRGKRRWRLF